jgi:WD40 repeat protein
VCGGTRALTGSWDTTLILWDTKHGTAGHVMREHTEAVTPSADCLVKLWDVATGNCRHTFARHTCTVSCVSSTKWGKRL